MAVEQAQSSLRTRSVEPPSEPMRRIRRTVSNEFHSEPRPGRDFCEICFNIDSRFSKYSSKEFPRRFSQKDLHKGQSNGCRFCTMLSSCIEAFPGYLDGDSIRCRGRISVFRDIIRIVDVYATAAAGEEWNILRLGRDVCRDPGSPSVFSFIEQQLESCLSKHEECGKDEVFTPTRLVFVGSEKKPMRLIEPSKDSSVRYAALSHCWGEDQPLQLKLDNLTAFRSSITEADLPPLYKDAVIVCKRLGIEYLWVDSL